MKTKKINSLDCLSVNIYEDAAS